MKLSVVICIYNEQDNIGPLIRHLDVSLKNMDAEVIMVDDGSSDKTVKEVHRNQRPWLKMIRLMKNYGQSSALAAGIDYAKGEYIVTMDGDLQNDSSDIPMLLSVIESEECDIVAGYRKDRKDNLIFRKLPSRLANILIRKSTGVKIKDYGCTLKIFRSEIAKEIKLYGELHRFIPVLASLEGYNNIRQIPVKHYARQYGHSKYNLSRTLKVFSDLILLLFFKKYLQRPMHLFGTVGVLATLAGIVINLYLLWLKLLGNDIWGKPLLVLGLILFLGGLQLITTGLVTDMLMRTYYESQQKKPYNIRSIKSFETVTEKVSSDHSKVAD